MISMRNFVGAICLCIATSQPAQAQELGQCHDLVSEAERLSCYDRLSGFTESDDDASGAGALKSGRQWTEETETSALDGRTDVWLNVRSENTQPNQIGKPEKANLFLRCIENKTDVILLFNSY